MVIHSIIEIYHFLTKYVQSRLMQISCMWERVNPPFQHTTYLQQTILKSSGGKNRKSIILEKRCKHIVAKGEIAHHGKFLI